MALRIRRLREVLRLVLPFCSGTFYGQPEYFIDLSVSHPAKIAWRIGGHYASNGGLNTLGFSTVPKLSNEPPAENEFLSFISSTLDESEGPHHCWLNKLWAGDSLRKDGIFLLLVGIFADDSFALGPDILVIFEKIKLLQQRYPQLNVIGYQSVSSVCSIADQAHLIQVILEDCITFPILLSNKSFSEGIKRPCLMLFKDFECTLCCHEKEVDLKVLSDAIDVLNVQSSGDTGLLNILKNPCLQKIDMFKEPYVCSSMRNLFLFFPGCVSADECGYRLFLSDSNHHRIIVSDENGKLLDCIGSSPGFEDGDFESAKLVRPAASFFHATEDCLYFVDSENHAIRRADLGRRVLETLHPSRGINKKYSLWSWIMNKLGLGSDDDTKCADMNSASLVYPWHLMKFNDESFLIMNRSFEDLWIMDMVTGEIKEVITGFSRIWDFSGEMIKEKLSNLKQLPCEWLKEQSDSYSLKGIPYADFLSSSTTFQNQIVICDKVNHRLLKYYRESQVFANVRFSNFAVLGLPYWVPFPLEKITCSGNMLHVACADHLQSFTLLPGKLDMKLTVDIPNYAELVEPLNEGCIWRQARGSATEISGAESIVASSEKVGVAQHWYDELDNLAFSTTESELIAAVDTTMDRYFHCPEDRICINCAVNTSPGTSEVIINAAIYLKLKKRAIVGGGSQKQDAERIVNLLNPKHIGHLERDACIAFLLNMNRDLDDLVFMKPLRVRLRLDCLDHPKADNSRDIVLTDSSIEVHVSLDS